MRTLLASGLLVVTLGLGAVVPRHEAAQSPVTERPVPTCQEDAVLIGSGDFVAGRWNTYVCGPSVDDIASGD